MSAFIHTAKNALCLHVKQISGPCDPDPGFLCGCLWDMKSHVGHRTILDCAGLTHTWYNSWLQHQSDNGKHPWEFLECPQGMMLDPLRTTDMAFQGFNKETHFYSI